MATRSIATSSADIPGTGSAKFPAAPSMPAGPDFPSLSTGRITDLSGRNAGGMAFVWTNLPAVIDLPHKVQGRLRDARDRALVKIQSEMVEWAQENAPWRDHTGDARALLHSPTISTAANGDRAVVLAHGVEYGIYLETMDGGAWGIIAKAIDHFAEQLPSRIAAELGR